MENYAAECFILFPCTEKYKTRLVIPSPPGGSSWHKQNYVHERRRAAFVDVIIGMYTLRDVLRRRWILPVAARRVHHTAASTRPTCARPP